MVGYGKHCTNMYGGVYILVDVLMLREFPFGKIYACTISSMN